MYVNQHVSSEYLLVPCLMCHEYKEVLTQSKKRVALMEIQRTPDEVSSENGSANPHTILRSNLIRGAVSGAG